jgi:hypothetical protein
MAGDWDATEQRLVAHSHERQGRLAKRDRWRRLLPWLLAPLLLPAAGAAALVAAVESAGGDLSEWPPWQAIAVPAAAFVVPAALSAWFSRRQGALEAVAWAIACVAVQVALVFGVGFLALGFGP